MSKRNIPTLSAVLIFTSFVLILLSATFLGKSIRSILENITTPVRKIEFSLISGALGIANDSSYKKLLLENESLKAKLSDQNKILSENKALRDQFEVGYPSPETLLPASVIGSPNFIPGVSFPTAFIIDRGVKDKVTLGDPVVIGSNLIGVVSKVSQNISKVDLISGNISFTAKTVPNNLTEKEAIGVVRGAGKENLVLDNVILSEVLKVGQTVVTKGDQGELGHGIPPNLIVGTIVSIDKKENAIFQKASVKPLVDYTRISTVFVEIR